MKNRLLLCALVLAAGTARADEGMWTFHGFPFAKANSAPIWKVSAPGWVTISTPQKPMSSAAQRERPTTSLSNSADTRVANSGAEKLIAMALASGIRLNAMSRNVCENPCETERIT